MACCQPKAGNAVTGGHTGMARRTPKEARPQTATATDSGTPMPGAPTRQATTKAEPACQTALNAMRYGPFYDVKRAILRGRQKSPGRQRLGNLMPPGAKTARQTGDTSLRWRATRVKLRKNKKAGSYVLSLFLLFLQPEKWNDRQMSAYKIIYRNKIHSFHFWGVAALI